MPPAGLQNMCHQLAGCRRFPVLTALVILLLLSLGGCEPPSDAASQTWQRARSLPTWRPTEDHPTYRLLDRLDGVGMIIEDLPSSVMVGLENGESDNGFSPQPPLKEAVVSSQDSVDSAASEMSRASEVRTVATAWTRRTGSGTPLWTTPFPFPLLLDPDGSIAPVAVAGLTFELNAQRLMFRRNLVPSLFGPNNWACKRGLLSITTEGALPPTALIARFNRLPHPSRLDPFSWIQGEPPRGHLRLDGGWRDAVLIPTGAVLSDSLLVPPDAALELAVGVLWPRSIILDMPVTIRGYDLDRGEHSGLLFSETFSPQEWAGRAWREVRIKLGKYGGQSLSLGLSVSSASSLPRLSVALAHPRILSMSETAAVPVVASERAGSGNGIAGKTPLEIPSGAFETTHIGGHDTQKTNLLMIVLDTVRADVLSGPHAARLLPNLLYFAQQNLWFRNTISTSSWTGPAVYSLITGHSPRALGLARDLEKGDNLTVQIPRGAFSIFRDLGQAGWNTWAYQTNAVLYNAALAEDFEIYHYHFDAPAQAVTQEALAWMKTRSGEAFAAYLHYLDPHLPYLSHTELEAVGATLKSPDRSAGAGQRVPKREGMHGLELHPDGIVVGFENPLRLQARGQDSSFRSQAKRLYEAELRHLDNSLGHLFQWMTSSGHLDDTVIVIATDHGEEFWDHGQFGHGHSFHGEVNDALLLMHIPPRYRWWKRGGHRAGLALTVQQRPSSLVDVARTVLPILGMPEDGGLSGINLLAPSEVPAARIRVGESVLFGLHQLAVVQGPWKLIMNGQTGKVQLFHRQIDPLEQHDLAQEQPQRVASLRARYADFVEEETQKYAAFGTTGDSASHTPLDPIILEQLRTLGYVQ